MLQRLSALLLGFALAYESGRENNTAFLMLQKRDHVEKARLRVDQSEWINVCYFTNWARYRNGLGNVGKDSFEMGLDGDLCTHFMYGFVFVQAGGANGGYMLKSNDPNADHPSGSEDQDGLCPDVCYDPSFRPDWNDPDGERCDWPCSPQRTLRGYEGLTKGMKAKNPNIKALASVGGWNFNLCSAKGSEVWNQGDMTCEIFSEIAASEAKTRLFAANIIEFCEKWGFDGFDLDWEYPVVAGHNRKDFSEAPEDYANYVNMLRILKEEFTQHKPSQPLLLTAAVGVGKSTAETAYDIPGMSQYLDLMNLMTYDLHGTWEDRTGCVAPLYTTPEDERLAGYPLSVSWAIDFWLEKGAPASKMTMGIPAYGRGWKLKSNSNTGINAPTDGACAKGTSTGEEGFRAYYEITDRISRGATKTHDPVRVCDYMVADGEWVGFDDVDTVCAKLRFAQSRGLAGSMVWALDLDEFTKGYTLISLLSSGGSTCGATTSQASTTTTTTTAGATTTTTRASTTAGTTSTAGTTTARTTAPVTTTTQSSGTGTCIHNTDCETSDWCDQKEVYETWCAQRPDCPWPYCLRSGSTGSTTGETSTRTTTQGATTTATTAVTTTVTTTTGVTTTVASGTCIHNTDCDTSDWCDQKEVYETWCAQRPDCPWPYCLRSGSSSTTVTTVPAGSRATTSEWGATDAKCEAACGRLATGVWPCGPGGPCAC